MSCLGPGSKGGFLSHQPLCSTNTEYRLCTNAELSPAVPGLLASSLIDGGSKLCKGRTDFWAKYCKLEASNTRNVSIQKLLSSWHKAFSSCFHCLGSDSALDTLYAFLYSTYPSVLTPAQKTARTRRVEDAGASRSVWCCSVSRLSHANAAQRCTLRSHNLQPVPTHGIRLLVWGCLQGEQ